MNCGFCTLTLAVLLGTFAQWFTSITFVGLSLFKVERFSYSGVCFRRLRIKVLKVLKLSNKQHMGSFYVTIRKQDCLQILYKFCKK